MQAQIKERGPCDRFDAFSLDKVKKAELVILTGFNLQQHQHGPLASLDQINTVTNNIQFSFDGPKTTPTTDEIKLCITSTGCKFL